MKTLFILLLFLGLHQSSSAQNRHGANWVFSKNVGIHFDSFDSLSTFSVQTLNWEASFSMSDSVGTHLFYLESSFRLSFAHGLGILGRLLMSNGNILPNGDSLLVQPSAAQGMTGIPIEGGYYLFHIGFIFDEVVGFVNSDGIILDEKELNRLVYRSKVERISEQWQVTEKNVPMSEDSVYEKMQLVRHANGEAWWLMVQREALQSTFIRYLVWDNGHIEGPFYQTTPIATTELEIQPAGQMKFSPNGNHLASARFFAEAIELYDFDRCTGLLSNSRTFREVLGAYYGLEFAPHAPLIYYTISIKSLRQIAFDENGFGSPISLLAINTTIPSDTNFTRSFGYGQLQLSSDHSKILFPLTTFDTTPFGRLLNRSISIIEHPDSVGLAAGLQTAAFFLGDSTILSSGLPNFPNYNLPPLSIYVADAGEYQTICLDSNRNKLVELGVPEVAGVQYQWFPNTYLNADTVAQPLAFPPASQWYYVWLTDSSITNACKTRLDSVWVEVTPPPIADFTWEQRGDTVFFNSTWESMVSTYHWDFGDGVQSTEQQTFHLYHPSMSQQSVSVGLIITNPCGSDTIVQNVALQTIVGISEQALSAAAISLYPNPAKDELQVVLPSGAIHIAAHSLHDVLGRAVAAPAIINTNSSYSLSVKSLSPGIYFLRLHLNNGQTVVKKVWKE